MYNKSEIKMSEEHNYSLYRVFAKLLNFLLIVSHNTDATYSQQARYIRKTFLLNVVDFCYRNTSWLRTSHYAS